MKRFLSSILMLCALTLTAVPLFAQDGKRVDWYGKIDGEPEIPGWLKSMRRGNGLAYCQENGLNNKINRKWIVPTAAESNIGWEDGLIAGQTLGHYIKALSQAQINPGLSEKEQGVVKNRLDYMIDELKKCQDLVKKTENEGYIFGASLINQEFRDNPLLEFDNVESGKQDIFTQAWVPWYTMHKILSGLNAAFKLAGNEAALEIANGLGLWIFRRTNKWNTGTKRTVLGVEYGGMNDCLYELYEINKDLKNNGVYGYEPEYEKYFAHHHFLNLLIFFHHLFLLFLITL